MALEVSKMEVSSSQKPTASEVEEGFPLLCFCSIAQFVASPTMEKNTHAADWSSSS